MSGTTTIISVPFTMTSAGPQTTPIATLYSILLQNAQALSPGLTVLPASLIDDVSGTQVAGLSQMDQARVDAVNSIAPGTANPFVLTQMGQMFGIPQGQPTNTSVDVVFSGAAGYVIAAGFTISDGTHQYVVQSPGGVIENSGSSAQLDAVATQSGSWTPLAGTVTQLVTSVPAGYTISVTNPQAGTPGQAAETVASYQARVYQAGQSPANGLSTTLLTNLQAISGVVARLTALRSVTGGWQVICGGGDQYAVAYAIYVSFCDIATLQGSTVSSTRNITATITDAPDTFNIVYVNPPSQTVTVSVIWNTQQPNFTAGATVNQLAAPALVNYLNSIQVGQPINELEMNAVFQGAVSSVIPAPYITTLEFSVYVNGTLTPPSAGTSAIPSDPESYWLCAANGVTVTQG